MFCVTVTPTSRTLAKVDLLNAARVGDVVELCLDHLIKEPDFSEMLADIGKPVLVSCRRKRDGGQYEGTEADRVMLLKRAIIAGPAYIELDADIAADVPRFGEVQRVIAYSDTDRPNGDMESLLDEARGLNADIVKFSWPMETLEDGWPLLKLVAGKRSTPVVGMGTGRSEVTFSLLSRRFGAPWVYAALEKGMEAHAEQPTIAELRDRYSVHEIGPKTTLVAVTGFDAGSRVTLETLNDAFRRIGRDVRCVPIKASDTASLSKRLKALKIRAVFAQGASRAVVGGLTGGPPADLSLKKGDDWKGYHTIAASGGKAIDTALGEERRRKSFLVLGGAELAAAIAKDLSASGAVVSVCAPDDKATTVIAQECDCRHVPFQALYSVLADVLVVADPDLEVGDGRKAVRAGFMRPEMTVADLTNIPADGPIIAEARLRGCTIVEPSAVFHHRMKAVFAKVTGGEHIPQESLALADERISAALA